MRKPSLQPSGSCRNSAASALAGWEALCEEREFCRDMLYYLVGFGQWRGEEEDRQTSGLFKRTSPTEVFLTGQNYKNSLLQMDSIGFEERSTERHRELFAPGKMEVSLRRKC